MRSPKPPQEDPETRARRQAAERRAEGDREQSLQRMTSDRTNELLRRFGQRAAMAGAGSLAPSLASMFGGGNAAGGGSSYSGGGSPTMFGGRAAGGGGTLSSTLAVRA